MRFGITLYDHVGEAPTRHCTLFPDIPLLSFAPTRWKLRLFAGECMPRVATGNPRHRNELSLARAEIRA